MNALICCEYSQTVTKEFLALGHNAFSNDILATEGDPTRHMQCDVVEAINSRPRWDLIILHIPCTAMGVCGNRTYAAGTPRHSERTDAISWTLSVWDAAVARSDAVALENPASVIFPILRKQRGASVQYVQPWEHGHPEQKKTGFAMWNLPRLMPTKNVHAEMMALPRSQRERVFFMSPGPDRGKERARFYPGLARAMATQWGGQVAQVAA
jgi:hypothetical protein